MVALSLAVEMRKPSSDGTREEDRAAVVRERSGQRRTMRGRGWWSERRAMSATTVVVAARGRGWLGEEVTLRKGRTEEVRKREGVNYY